MSFTIFKKAIQRQFEAMKGHTLFRVAVERDQLWQTYLASFPAGTNEIYRERTEHDCNCCKNFIRAIGGVVAIQGGELVSIWDISIDGFYQQVAEALAAEVKAAAIGDLFIHFEPRVGTDRNYELLASGQTQTWEHFCLQLPAECVMDGATIGTALGRARTAKAVLERALEEIDAEAVETVLDLIGQNSLYRGEEHRFVLESFAAEQRKYRGLDGARARELFCWARSQKVHGSVIGIRTNAIGSLLADLSEGKDLERAVNAFETKMAGDNYQRPTALVTTAQRDKARQVLADLGLETALLRRPARLEDITVNNVLYADRAARKVMSALDCAFDGIATRGAGRSLDRVEEVGIDKFLTDIVPHAESIELYVENRHCANFVSLIAPAVEDAKELFKWRNRFSWSYAGNLADSIKERVKSAGGRVDADLCCRLSWRNHDDLDLRMVEPNGHIIYYGNKTQLSGNGGTLDVDMNAHTLTRTPVENIYYADRRRMKEGVYRLEVNQYRRRESHDSGFEVEIEFDGSVHTFSQAASPRTGGTVEIARISYTRAGGFQIIKSLPSSEVTREVWGVSTNAFHRVEVAMLSPNFWDGQAVGNKHYFFMLEGCKSDGQSRGFFNEFLRDELREHRKTMEIVGSKMLAEGTAEQLSGLGFSSTQRAQVLCRVTGSFARTIKILF